MSWKDLFYKQDEETPVVTTPNKSAIITPKSVSAVGGTDFGSHFDKLMHDSDQEGPDYKEFAEALASPDVPSVLTEEQKYKMIMTTFKTQKVTKETLVTSAQEYIRIFDKEKKDFSVEIEGAKMEQVTKLEEQVKEKQEMIAKLTLEVQDLSQKKAVSEQKLVANENNFNITHAQRVAIIQSDIERINKYL